MDVNPNNIYNLQNFHDAYVGYQDEDRLKDKDEMIEQLKEIISTLKK